MTKLTKRMTKVDIWLKNVHLAYDVPSLRKLRSTKVDIWLKNVHLAYDVPSTPRSPRSPRSPFSSFERRPAYPCAALAGIPALECARAAKGNRPRTAPRALLPKLRLDGAGFHPALGPGERGFLDAHSHYHVPSSTSARGLRAPQCKPQGNKLLRPCSCWLRCLVRAQIRKRGAPRGRPLQRWRSFCLRLRARDVGNNM